MGVAVRTDREGDRASIVLTGPFDLAHAPAVAEGVESAEACLGGCRSVDVDLSQLDHIDGAGAVLLARLLDRLDADKCGTRIVGSQSTIWKSFTTSSCRNTPETAQWVLLYEPTERETG